MNSLFFLVLALGQMAFMIVESVHRHIQENQDRTKKDLYSDVKKTTSFVNEF